MKIHLPNSAFLGNIDAFLSSIDDSDPKKLYLTANKKWISVHPVVLSMVAALGLSMDSPNIFCEEFEAKSKHYFERMGLFKFLGIASNIKVVEHESAGRFVPLTQIKNSNELSDFITEMIPLLHLESKQADPIKYIISELVRNVLEHSQSEIGAVLCAQFYSKSNTIRIGIVDLGVGIKRTINFSHEAETDLDAMRLALTPGVTGATSREGGTDFNAGAGLFFIKSIAKVSRNLFAIYSGNAIYKLLKTSPVDKKVRLYADPFKDHHSKHENLPFWAGTVVGVDISLDVKEEFSLLLDLVREAYFKAITERKIKRHKKPKFI